MHGQNHIKLLPLMPTTRLPAVDWTDAPRRLKWTRPFRPKTKCCFCACAITFQTQSTTRHAVRNQKPTTAVITNIIIVKIIIFLIRLVTKPRFICSCPSVALSDHHKVFILAARLKHYSLAFQIRGPSSSPSKPYGICGGQRGIGTSSPSNSGLPCQYHPGVA